MAQTLYGLDSNGLTRAVKATGVEVWIRSRARGRPNVIVTKSALASPYGPYDDLGIECPVRSIPVKARKALLEALHDMNGRYYDFKFAINGMPATVLKAQVTCFMYINQKAKLVLQVKSGSVRSLARHA